MDTTVRYASDLKLLLQMHDKTVVQLNFLDAYIARLVRQAKRAMLLGRKGHVLHYMGRKSVVEAISYMYKQYRFQKWHQIQTLVSEILKTAQSDATSHLVVAPDNDLGTESDQVERYSQTMMVAFCNFSRYS